MVHFDSAENLSHLSDHLQVGQSGKIIQRDWNAETIRDFRLGFQAQAAGDAAEAPLQSISPA